MNSPLEDFKDISLLLGDRILNIHTIFGSDGDNGWLETVLTYITLERNGVINFPFSGNRIFSTVSLDPQAKQILPHFREQIIGQTIKDFHFVMEDAGESDIEWLPFIELSNGRVLHENRISPYGTGHTDFFMYTREQFEAKIKDLCLKIASLTS